MRTSANPYKTPDSATTKPKSVLKTQNHPEHVTAEARQKYLDTSHVTVTIEQPCDPYVLRHLAAPRVFNSLSGNSELITTLCALLTRSSAIVVIADRTACSILTLFIAIATSRPLNKKIRSLSVRGSNNYCGSASAIRSPHTALSACRDVHHHGRPQPARPAVSRDGAVCHIVDKRAVSFRLPCTRA